MSETDGAQEARETDGAKEAEEAHETDDAEEAPETEDASAGPSAVPRSTLLVAAVIAIAALVVGAAGGFMFRGGSDGTGGTEQPPFDPGNVVTRAEGLDGAPQQAEVQDDAGTDESGEPGSNEVGTAVPVDGAVAALIAEEQRRLAERARQASESFLAPAVADARELVERWRKGEPEAGPAAVPAMPDAGGVPPLPGSESEPPALKPALADGIDAGLRTHVLARGSVIPAVLESSIDSDLPGLVRAKVAENVYDTVTGSRLLVPKGSWLVGTYGSNARTGQRRLFVAWTDLQLPDGTPVPLGGTASLGADGASGVKGRRSTGIWTALGAAILLDLAGNASDIIIAAETGEAPAREGGLAEIVGQATGNAASEVGQRYVGELLDRGTRFRVDAGARMNVVVEEDMHLPAQPAGGAW